MIEVWTLLVRSPHSRDAVVSVHESEREAMVSLRDNYDQAGEGPYIPEQPELYEVWQEAFAEFFDLDVTIDKHTLPEQRRIVVATVDTRNFEFQGAGEDAHEARLALMACLRRHAQQTPGVDEEYLLVNTSEDIHLTTYEPGKCYRDGEELR